MKHTNPVRIFNTDLYTLHNITLSIGLRKYFPIQNIKNVQLKKLIFNYNNFYDIIPHSCKGAATHSCYVILIAMYYSTIWIIVKCTKITTHCLKRKRPLCLPIFLFMCLYFYLMMVEEIYLNR